LWSAAKSEKNESKGKFWREALSRVAKRKRADGPAAKAVTGCQLLKRTAEAFREWELSEMPVKKQGCESSFDKPAVRFRLAGMGSDLRWRTWKHVFRESASRFTRLRSQLHHAWAVPACRDSPRRGQREGSALHHDHDPGLPGKQIAM